MNVGAIGGNAWMYKLYTTEQGRCTRKFATTPEFVNEAVKVTISKEARELYKAMFNGNLMPVNTKKED